jgi:hypothetical protein
MTFAYLILAHKNPAQLHRLVQTLDSNENIFIIHVDAKVAVRPFIKFFENYSSKKIFFCPNRKNIVWGSYGMVEATISLIHFLLKMEFEPDYVHLISGQDYPVRDNEEITSFFKNHNGKNFLNYFSLPDKRWPENGMNRIQFRWAVNEHQSIFHNDLDYKKAYNPMPQFPEGITPYGGSQWWSLNINCIRFLMEEYLRDNSLFQFYRYSLIPDEMLFQTLILNSRFKDTVVNENLRYIKWQNGALHPETIGIDHLSSMVVKGELFARKFESEDNILDQLDIHRKNKDKTKQIGECFLAKNREISSNGEKKWCIISAVGKTSLHRNWINKYPAFDTHLIVYDDSYEKFKHDTAFIVQDKGSKFNLVNNYLNANKKVLNQYDYFYIPDDDIDIDSLNIHKLFNYMKEYKLAIAQPAINNSYYSYPHTHRRPNSILRYTNFVEVMQPCFSAEALKKVLFTFNENKSGWGIDFRWGELVNYSQFNMAIIDDVISLHTRSVQSNHHDELNAYLQKYNLSRKIIENL